ncbi:pyridoxamine 5'-phosphate oxidase family protein [Bacteroides graminisolvens]|uniref:pyridoxamine 5'-phosphate oxidase family protein n=1 Tax=Bacteroides graminisolvens TaxID=477666 RepID=UPI003B71193C
MFREMRRKKQVLSREESIEVLNRGSAGVLAVTGDEDYPYAVPISYVYYNNKILLHSARSGHKVDALVKNPKVSFCVIDENQIVPEEYTTYFRSVIVFGKAHFIEDDIEKRKTLEILTEKYSGQMSKEHMAAAIDKEIKALIMIEIEIEHLSGKEAIEFVRAKQKKVD